MGQYVTADDIVEKGGLSDSEVEDIIDSWEDFVHTYCNDIFYEWTGYVFRFRGAGKSVLFIDTIIPYNLCSIDSIVFVKTDGSTSTIDSDYYTFNQHSITRYRAGAWTLGARPNHIVTCSIGNASTDIWGNDNPRNLPKGIARAVQTLVVRDISTLYGTTSGTSTIVNNRGYEFSEEVRHDYKYKRVYPGKADRNDPHPTGIPSIDLLLRNLQRRVLTLAGLDKNPNDVGEYYEANILTGE